MTDQSIITISDVSFKYEDLPKLKEKYLAKPGDIVIKGDGHGNWRNVLLTLQIQGVANLTKQQHDRLNELYKIPGESLSHVDILEIFDVFLNIDFKPEVITKDIGDLVGDRGQCDIPMFILIFVMKEKGIKVDITISNHDQAFLDVWQKGLMRSIKDSELAIVRGQLACQQRYDKLEKEFKRVGWSRLSSDTKRELLALDKSLQKYQQNAICFDTTLTGPFPGSSLIVGAQDNSLQMLGVLLKNNTFTEIALEPFINAYIDSLKLLDYQLSPDKKSIALLSHAPFPVSHYGALAIELGMPKPEFDDNTPQKLAASIDRLNQHYKMLLKEKDDRVFNIAENSILYKVIWSRWKGIIKSKNYADCFQPMHKEYNVYYIHGHDGPHCVPRGKENFIVSVDSHFAKSGIDGKESITLYHWDGRDLNINRIQHADALESHTPIPPANTDTPAPSALASSKSAVVQPNANNSVPNFSSRIKIEPKKSRSSLSKNGDISNPLFSAQKNKKNGNSGRDFQNTMDQEFIYRYFNKSLYVNNEQIIVAYQEKTTDSPMPNLQVFCNEEKYLINIEPEALSAIDDNCNAYCCEVMIQTFEKHGEKYLNLICENLPEEKILELVKAAIKHGFVFELTSDNISMVDVFSKLKISNLEKLKTNICNYNKSTKTTRRQIGPEKNSLFSGQADKRRAKEADDKEDPFNPTITLGSAYTQHT